MPLHNPPPAVAIAVAEEGAEVVAELSALDFGKGFDVTEDPSGEANVALDLTEDVWTFAEGGFYLRDGSGPLLYTGPSGDDLFLTGDLDVSGSIAVGNAAIISGAYIISVTHDSDALQTLFGERIWVTNRKADYATVVGLTGRATLNTPTAATAYCYGLDFQATVQSYSTASQLHGSRLMLMVLGNAATTVGEAWGQRIICSWGSHVTLPTLHVFASDDLGVNIENGGTVYGLHLPDFSNFTTVYLLELGPAAPYLRLVGGGDPGANQTNLYLKEQATQRRVQWKDGAAIGGGDRVMVLV